jgi:hypothetical protein
VGLVGRGVDRRSLTQALEDPAGERRVQLGLPGSGPSDGVEVEAAGLLQDVARLAHHGDVVTRLEQCAWTRAGDPMVVEQE